MDYLNIALNQFQIACNQDINSQEHEFDELEVSRIADEIFEDFIAHIFNVADMKEDSIPTLGRFFDLTEPSIYSSDLIKYNEYYAHYRKSLCTIIYISCSSNRGSKFHFDIKDGFEDDLYFKIFNSKWNCSSFKFHLKKLYPSCFKENISKSDDLVNGLLQLMIMKMQKTSSICAYK